MKAAEFKTTAIIINFNGGPLLLDCLASLSIQTQPVEVVIVDNGSTDDSLESAQARFPHATIVRPGHNVGFGAGANLGATHAAGDVFVFLNPDVVLHADCIARLSEELRRPRVGVCGPSLWVTSSQRREVGATIDPLGYPAPTGPGKRPLYVSGCALACRREVFEVLGGFDDRLFMFVEDVDFCWRVLLSGWDVTVAEGAYADHVGGTSAKGGYIRGTKLMTTSVRVGLRERNTLATLLKCYGWPTLLVLTPLYLLQVATVAVLMLWEGRSQTARAMLTALGWNIHELPRTLALRRVVQRSRVLPDKSIWVRMHRGIMTLRLLHQVGVPIVEEVSPRSPSRLSK